MPECIGVEVTVPDRTPVDRADLVVFRDKERTKPFGVIECKRDGVSDTEFKQALEQAFGNGHAHKFRAEYIGVIAGQTRAFYDCPDKFSVLEREANIVADLPIQYGKPEEFKYYKNAFPKPDIGAVTRDDLIKTIRKCHQTLWGGGRLSPPMAFGELTKLIFLKTRDEKTPTQEGPALRIPDQDEQNAPAHRLRLPRYGRASGYAQNPHDHGRLGKTVGGLPETLGPGDSAGRGKGVGLAGQNPCRK